MTDFAAALTLSDFSELDVSLVTDGLEFPEGPVVMPDGSVVICEIEGERLTLIPRLGNRDWGQKQLYANVPGGPNGAALGPDGALYICNNGGSFEWHQQNGLTFPGPRPATWTGGRIERVDPITREVTELYRTSLASDGSEVELRGPNDLVMDGHGGFWFTDHGTRTERTADRTGIHYGLIDGSLCREVIFPTNEPNGIGLSPAGDVLYWAETHTGRVFSRPIVAPGIAGAPGPYGGLLVGLPDFQLLDSLAIDGDGRVCVATLIQGGITVVSPSTGETVKAVLPSEWGDPLTTNIAFGGPDMKTAFITLSATGRLVEVTWPVVGLPLAH